MDGMEDDVACVKDRYWDAADEFEVWKPHSWSNLFPNLRPNQADRCPCKSVTNMDQIMIGIYGDVIPCSMDINYTLSLGTLRDQSLEEILSGDETRNLQALNAAGEIETKDTCRGCVYLNADSSDVLLESKTHQLQISR